MQMIQARGQLGKKLPTGNYSGFLMHNEAGYYMEIVDEDGTLHKVPITIKPLT